MKDLKDTMIVELLDEFAWKSHESIDGITYGDEARALKQQILSRFAELESHYDMKKTESELHERALAIANDQLLKCKRNLTLAKTTITRQDKKIARLEKVLELIIDDLKNGIIIIHNTIEQTVQYYMEKADELDNRTDNRST